MTTPLSRRLAESFTWVDPGPHSSHLVSDTSGWWRDPDILAGIGPALVAPFRSTPPTVVIAPAVTGLLLGPLAAAALGVGFAVAHKPAERRLPGAVTWADSPPDYRGRQVRLGILDRHLGPGDRVLAVDDWVASGAQLRAVRDICVVRGAHWVGSAALVADCPPEQARDLGLHALLRAGDLHPDEWHAGHPATRFGSGWAGSAPTHPEPWSAGSTPTRPEPWSAGHQEGPLPGR
ncbi:phosphoribosyltransferase [Micromonospora echinofusca]|uniref:Phosphoribosyltransferase n=1 Tax=Micromonospora echinofusca TaxID=47858 RepID=A0ABS3VMW5_MICEH|nr:phosphoribosyltransferase [Micromonospora echinofusca]